MPSYKLIYFMSRCRAEPIHMMFHMIGVEYENVAIRDAGGDDFRKIKPLLPFGHVPVLEVDGVKLTQSKAIIRYLGREFGFYGKTSLEAAQIDCAMDATDDVIFKAGQIYWHPDFPGFQVPADVLENFFKSRTEAIEQYSKTLRKLLTDLEKLFEMVEGDFFVGDEITIADMFFFAACNYSRFFVKDPFEGFPILAALNDRIIAHPKIKKYLDDTSYKPYEQFKPF
ncbi:hematopoietic prostaglandin D synthase-like isoform X1 [Amphiura filiformis]|uniref:hematopoietic prostaglandin D synthase-like isoform X1 n=1 Tax=Amphiura filiformis TaxID=82378 RepID=UPI003B21F95D